MVLGRSDNNPLICRGGKGSAGHCYLVDLPNFLNGIDNTGSFSLLNIKPCSRNLTCSLPAPLIVADVLTLKVPVAADRDPACRERPPEPT